MAPWDAVPDDLRAMRRRALFTAFSPAAPVDRREVFAGRADQLAALTEVVMQRGQHAVIYGERGVGKTSLAKVAREIAERDRMFTAHITCDSSDSFHSIWLKVLAEISIASDPEDDEVRNAADYLRPDREVTPNDVRVVLQRLVTGAPVVVFIDEFDVVPDVTTRRATAEVVKVLSDQGVNATIVLVGVAENVTDLITEHASTERNLIQVPMPRMSPAERHQIIIRGLADVEMTIEDEAARRIVVLSQGLAQFVHLLAQRAALVCLDEDRLQVSQADVETAVQIALRDTHASITHAYYAATASNQQTLYPSLLLACALAPLDERGFFTARSLVEPMTRVAGRPLDIPAFGPHLDRLTNERGPVLRKEGEKRRYRYRFLNPLMQPYVLMRGISEGRISFEELTPVRDER